MQRYLRSARQGRSNAFCDEVSDLPRCALIKVAWHCFIERSPPPRRRGKPLVSDSSQLVRPAHVLLLPEVLLASPNMIPLIFRADFHAMPFAVFEVVWRVVTDAVLIAQFGCNLVKNAFNSASTILVPVSR